MEKILDNVQGEGKKLIEDLKLEVERAWKDDKLIFDKEETKWTEEFCPEIDDAPLRDFTGEIFEEDEDLNLFTNTGLF